MKVINESTNSVEVIVKLRGIAALMVFLFHLVCLSNSYISNKLLVTFFFYGKYGVQFFFVISGFVIMHSMIAANYTTKNILTFFKKRLIRIEPPYIIIVLATAAFLFLRQKLGLGTNNVNGQLPEINQIMLHIGYLIPFSRYQWLSIVFWTLAIEFQFYTIISLLFFFYIRYTFLRCFFSVVFIVLSVLSVSEVHFLYWSPIFLLGLYLSLYKQAKISYLEFLCMSTIFFVHIFFKMKISILIFSVIPFLLIYFEPIIKSKWLDFLGKISYSLYLCHTLVAFTIINLGIRYTKYFYQKIFFVASAVILTILFSYWLYFFVEKPFKKIASSIKYNNE